MQHHPPHGEFYIVVGKIIPTLLSGVRPSQPVEGVGGLRCGRRSRVGELEHSCVFVAMDQFPSKYPNYVSYSHKLVKCKMAMSVDSWVYKSRDLFLLLVTKRSC